MIRAERGERLNGAGDIEQRFAAAYSIHQQGQVRKAAEAYAEILRDVPEHFESLRWAGIAHFQLGQLEQGVRLIEVALRVRPSSAEAYADMAKGLHALGRYADALGYADQSLTISDNEPAVHFSRANTLAAMSRHSEAISAYDRAIALKPDYVEALNNKGLSLVACTRYEDALASYHRALKLRPNYPRAHNNLGLALAALDRHREAILSYEQAIALQTNYLAALSNRGNSLLALGEVDKALQSYDHALAIDSDSGELLAKRAQALRDMNRQKEARACWNQALANLERGLANSPASIRLLIVCGETLSALERYSEALTMYRQALSVAPDDINALSGVGLTLAKLEQYQEALSCLNDAIELHPRDCAVLNNLGLCLVELGRERDALETFERALRIAPNYFEALRNCGLAAEKVGRHEDAVGLFDRALRLRPGRADVHKLRGVSLQSLGNHEAALRCFDAVLLLNPRDLDAHINAALCLTALRRFPEALSYLDQLLAKQPSSIPGLSNRGALRSEIGAFEEAVEDYDHVLSIKSDSYPALINRGYALLCLNRAAQAADSYNRALDIAVASNYPVSEVAALHSAAFEARTACCQWDEFEQHVEQVVGAVEAGHMVGPFIGVTFLNDPRLQLKAAECLAATRYPVASQPLWCGERYCHQRIRIAYLSADFHDHATAFLMAGLFANHDHSRFEISAVSFGQNVENSALRGKLKPTFDHFVEASQMSDLEIAQLLREDEIDIAIDLKGYTHGCRPGIFALRPAPIQVNYLGYPGTMGTNYIDYIIADQCVIPPGHQMYFSEKVVYLPGTYQVNDDCRVMSEVVPTRIELGLPEQGFVFCSFNNSYKLTPQIFDIWMRLLRNVEGSVLWLLQRDATVVDNLRREAERRGVSANRLLFAQPLPVEQHLARQRQADLFLDTLPVNAHTTASDALWVGLPIVTCIGNTFAGRVCASLLQAVGLSELIANSFETYEALALELATNSDKLMRIKSTLQRNRLTTPLFSTKRFARHIEKAYQGMWQRHQTGEPPLSFAVDEI